MIRLTWLRAAGLATVAALALTACGGGATTAADPSATPGEQAQAAAMDEQVDPGELAEQISAAIAATGPVSITFAIEGEIETFSGVLDTTGETDAIRIDLGEGEELLVVGDEAFVTGLSDTETWTRFEVTEGEPVSQEGYVATVMAVLAGMVRLAATSFRLLDEPNVSEVTMSEVTPDHITYSGGHSDAAGFVELHVTVDTASLPVSSRLRVVDPESGGTNELRVTYGPWGAEEPVVAPDQLELP